VPKPIIPVILTVADWNAKKGVIAKMAGETGIGAALAKLKVEFDKAPWDVLDPDLAYSANTKTGKGTLALAQKLGAIAISKQNTLEPTRKELQAIKTLTESIEKKWKASKIIPSSSTAHVGKMKVAADQFMVALNANSRKGVWDAEEKRLTQIESRLKGIALEAIKPYFESIRKFGTEVKKSPTVANYVGEAKTGFHQNIRGLNAALDRSLEPAWIAWKDIHWKPLAQDSYKPTKDGDVVAKVDKVLEVLEELKKQTGL
jgi:hypothetical protein